MNQSSGNGIDIKTTAAAAIQTSCAVAGDVVEASTAMRMSQASSRMRNSIIRITSSLLNALALGLWLGGVLSNGAALGGFTAAGVLAFVAGVSSSRLFFRQVE